jgi:hypothetical protein
MIGQLMNMEQFIDWKLAWETEVLRENQPHSHFVDHKSHMTWHQAQAAKVGNQQPAIDMASRSKEGAII